MRSIVLVGAASVGIEPSHYGGALTLSSGVVEYASSCGIEVDIVNTLKPRFERDRLSKRVISAGRRFGTLVALLRQRKHVAVVILSGAGLSFIERALFAGVARYYGVRCALLIIDGWFLAIEGKSRATRFFYSLFLKIPNVLVASGSNWIDCFLRLSVREDKIISVYYWLPRGVERRPKPLEIGCGEVVRFIFVGWMIKEKGVLEILSVLDSIIGKHRLHFTFIGGGTLLSEVRDHICSRGWDDFVVALGWLPPEQVVHELRSAHIFVLPSYAEGFPLSLIEAMSQGLPAICTDVGGVSDSLLTGINGVLIKPKDVTSLENAMTFYLENRDVISVQSSNAITMVNNNHDAEKNCRVLFDSLWINS